MFPHRLWTCRNTQLDSYPAGAALGLVEADGGRQRPWNWWSVGVGTVENRNLDEQGAAGKQAAQRCRRQVGASPGEGIS